MAIIPNIQSGSSQPQEVPQATPAVVEQQNPTIFDGLSSDEQSAVENILSPNANLAAQPGFFNMDGTLLADLEEMQFYAQANEEVADVEKRENGTYISIDTDGDGKYDQFAFYDNEGNKRNETVNRDGDMTDELYMEYDEDGNVSAAYIDSDDDGVLDNENNNSANETSGQDKVEQFLKMNPEFSSNLQDTIALKQELLEQMRQKVSSNPDKAFAEEFFKKQFPEAAPNEFDEPNVEF